MSFCIRRGQDYLIRFNEEEAEAVKIAAGNLRTDIAKVLEMYSTSVPESNTEKKTGDTVPEIIIGTIGVSTLLPTDLSDAKMRDEQGNLRKEAYTISVWQNKLVIAGTDRRGTIYGIYDFCEQIGVSPWYFWGDVPVKKKQEIRIPVNYCKTDYPVIEYRGIFINDEEELDAWVAKHMGEPTIGVRTYEKIFELLLRLKANYIWPAMHVNSFNMIPENGALADRMGIVVGTSHCDMLMRSNNREWIPWINKKGYQDAEYDYSIPGRNREILQEYWRESVEQNRDFEVCYTLGMRGIHDSGFETRDLEGKSPEEIRQAKVELLEQIIHDQREILSDTLGRDTMKTFIPYKEVLELYDNGLEIPEDMTLVWANDNYGHIRRYPSEKERQRKGGHGIYYHNSYWAPPSMSYVFLCSIPLAHTRNELRKAYEEGIRKLWVLNVGAMKPLEQEITFFLRLAWEIGKEGALTEDVDAYVTDWIDRTFTGGIGEKTARLLNDFSQLTNVRKLENMDYDAFSQTAYGDEAVIRIHKYEELFTRGNAIYEGLPEEERDAFFQLVLMRIHAAYFTNLQFYYGDRSTLAYNQGKMQAAALYTAKSQAFDDARRRMLIYYNQRMKEGKWDGILNPESFPPPRAAMMPICTPPIAIGEQKMVVNVWNEGDSLTFVKPGTKWIEIGNGGEGEFEITIQTPDWVVLSEAARSTIRTEKRILITALETKENREGEIVITKLTDGEKVTIPVRTVSVDTRCENLEEDGMVCIQGDSAQSPDFRKISRLGRCCGSLMEAKVKCSMEATGQENWKQAVPLRYPVYFTSEGVFLLEIHRFPSLDSTGRIRIGVSVDNGSVQIIESTANDEWRGNWKKNVLNNVDRLYCKLPALSAGLHSIELYAVDKYFAFSRLVIYTTQRKENNLAGVSGAQELPMEWDLAEWEQAFYGDIALKPRPVEYAVPEVEHGNLEVTSIIKYPESYGAKVEPQYYLEEGSHIFREKEGAIRIDAAAVLAQSPYAYTANYQWQYCSSESYGRSGLAMYIRKPEQKWEMMPEAPSLNYVMECEGGNYTIWMLAKYNIKEESYYAAGIDDKMLTPEQLYCKGCLFRYESEQIYRWIPMRNIELEKGTHTLRLYAQASGMRFDRIYVTRGEELPPLDTQWQLS